jgi:biopolymer transport protein ExbD
MAKKERKAQEINASSMADIAFLLLIFFLVTTTIASDKGLAVQLPPKKTNQDIAEVNQRNVFKILINSYDRLLVEDEVGELAKIKEQVKEFLTNEGVKENLSENPTKAVVSIKTDRGTSYERYVAVMDEVKKAYTEVRAAYVGVSPKEFLETVSPAKTPKDKELYEKARAKYPYQVSDAEPTSIGGK